MSVVYQQWHTWPVEPRVMVIETEEPVKMSSYKENIQQYAARPITHIIDKNDAFYSQIVKTLETERLNHVERYWFTSMLNSFDSSVKNALDATHYDLWDEEWVIRKQYADFYKGDFYLPANAPIRLVMARLMSYSEIITEMRNVPQSRCGDGDTCFDIFFSAPAPKQVWPMDHSGQVRVDADQVLQTVSSVLDPVHNWGVLPNRGTGNPNVNNAYKCCHQPLDHPGCWMSIVDGQPKGTPLRYEVVKTNYWPEIAANDNYVFNAQTFVNDIQVGTAFLHVDKYVRLNERIQEQWPNVARLISRGYEQYVDALQAEMDVRSDGRISLFTPTFYYLRNDVDVLNQFFSLLHDYNEEIDGASTYDPDAIYSFMDQHVFHVKKVTASFTFALRGGILLGPGVRVRPLSTSNLKSLGQVDAIMDVLAPGGRAPNAVLYDMMQQFRTVNLIYIDQMRQFDIIQDAVRRRKSFGFRGYVPFHVQFIEYLKEVKFTVAMIDADLYRLKGEADENTRIVYGLVGYVNSSLRNKPGVVDPDEFELSDFIVREELNNFVEETAIISTIVDGLNYKGRDLKMDVADENLLKDFSDLASSISNEFVMKYYMREISNSDPEKFRVLATFMPELRHIRRLTRFVSPVVNYIERTHYEPQRDALQVTMRDLEDVKAAYADQLKKDIKLLKDYVSKDDRDGVDTKSNGIIFYAVTSQYAHFVNAIKLYVGSKLKRDAEWKAAFLSLLNSDPLNAVVPFEQAVLFVEKRREKKEPVPVPALPVVEKKKKTKPAPPTSPVVEKKKKTKPAPIPTSPVVEKKKKATPRSREQTSLLKDQAMRLIETAVTTAARKAALKELGEKFDDVDFTQYEHASKIMELFENRPEFNQKGSYTKEMSGVIREWQDSLKAHLGLKVTKPMSIEELMIYIRTIHLQPVYDYFQYEFPKKTTVIGYVDSQMAFNPPFDEDFVRAARENRFFVSSASGMPERVEYATKIDVDAPQDPYQSLYVEGIDKSQDRKDVMKTTWRAFLNYVVRLGTSQQDVERTAVLNMLPAYNAVVPVQISNILFEPDPKGPVVKVQLNDGTVIPTHDPTATNLFDLTVQKWKDNSCWFDSAFLTLFGMRNTSFSRRVFHTRKFYKQVDKVVHFEDGTKSVYGKSNTFSDECTDDELRKIHATIVDDIVMVQTRTCPKQPLKSLHFWDMRFKCFQSDKVEQGDFGRFDNAITNLRQFYGMEDLISWDEIKLDERFNGKEYQVRVNPKRIKSQTVRMHIIYLPQTPAIRKKRFMYNVPLTQPVGQTQMRLYGIVSWESAHFYVHLYDFKSNQWVYFNIKQEQDGKKIIDKNVGEFKRSGSDGFPFDAKEINSVKSTYNPIAYVYLSQVEIDELLGNAKPGGRATARLVADAANAGDFNAVEDLMNQDKWEDENERVSTYQIIYEAGIIEPQSNMKFFSNALDQVGEGNVEPEQVAGLIPLFTDAEQDDVGKVVDAIFDVTD